MARLVENRRPISKRLAFESDWPVSLHPTAVASKDTNVSILKIGFHLPTNLKRPYPMYRRAYNVHRSTSRIGANVNDLHYFTIGTNELNRS